uniref:Histone H4.1 n=1 Tax=Crypthecodinium cohnii TaxID=2866 RepID=A0A8K1X8M7_CRYCO|nr:histone H4.1 [Crypthecodinium cohnii]
MAPKAKAKAQTTTRTRVSVTSTTATTARGGSLPPSPPKSQAAASSSTSGAAAASSVPVPKAFAANVRAVDPEQLRRGLAALALLAPTPPTSGTPAPKASGKKEAGVKKAAAAQKKESHAHKAAGRASSAPSAVPIGGALSSKVRRKLAVAPDNANITNPDIRRLARRAGCQRISAQIYDETKGLLATFLQDILNAAAVYTDHAKRKTVALDDVIYSLKRRGKVVYGSG